MSGDTTTLVKNLSCWNTPVDPIPLGGGITNTNFTVQDGERKYVVRIGEDIPVHGIMRFNELSASRAAHGAGLSPEVFHSENGVLVIDFIASRTLSPADIRNLVMLEQIVPIIRRVHHDIPRYLEGPVLSFWVFQVLRDYRRTLRQANSRMIADLDGLESIAHELEHAVGSVHLVFGHNDLLAANFLDDGQRLWIIDWDYAGFNSPLFDLANLASNNEFDVDLEHRLLELYFHDGVPDKVWQSFSAMKCASLLREAMWSMVSEIHSTLDFDYVAYTTENLERFNTVYEHYKLNRS